MSPPLQCFRVYTRILTASTSCTISHRAVPCQYNPSLVEMLDLRHIGCVVLQGPLVPLLLIHEAYFGPPRTVACLATHPPSTLPTFGSRRPHFALCNESLYRSQAVICPYMGHAYGACCRTDLRPLILHLSQLVTLSTLAIDAPRRSRPRAAASQAGLATGPVTEPARLLCPTVGSVCFEGNL